MQEPFDIIDIVSREDPRTTINDNNTVLRALLPTSAEKTALASLSGAANFETPKSLALTGNVALDFGDLAPHLHLSGLLAVDTYIELPAPTSETYLIYLRNFCTGAGRLFVQKATGGSAVEVKGVQLTEIRVNP